MLLKKAEKFEHKREAERTTECLGLLPGTPCVCSHLGTAQLSEAPKSSLPSADGRQPALPIISVSGSL